MAKNTAIFVIIGILAIVLLGMYLQNKTDLFAISGSETMTRTGPTQVNPSQSFQITYTSLGVSGNWGATIQDSVSGGCSFPAGTTLRTVMLSDEGTTKTISVTAPSSGTCTFTGDYQFGTNPIKNFNSYSVTIGGGGGCTPDNSCQANTCIGSTCTNNCGTVLQGTKNCAGCIPNCAGKQCGDNGCGGSCGTCPSGQSCSSGICSTPTTAFDWCSIALKFNFFTIYKDDPCINGSIIMALAVLLGVIILGKL